jgi:hypothetical protein
MLPAGLPKQTNGPRVTHLCPRIGPGLGRPGHIGRIHASSPDTYRPTCHSHIFIFVFHFGFSFSFSFLLFFSPFSRELLMQLPAVGARPPTAGRHRPSELVIPPPAARALLPPPPLELSRRRQSSSSRHPPDILLPPAVLCILLAAATDEVVLRVHPSAPAGSNEVGVGGLFSNSSRRRRAWSSVEGERRGAWGERRGIGASEVEGRRLGSTQRGGGGGGRDMAREEESEASPPFLDDTVGWTPRPKRMSAFFCPLGRPKWTESDRFGHENGFRWRCPKGTGDERWNPRPPV